MSSVSTIPSQITAEMSGAGSFFGSCQIAANNFESYLQSAGNNVPFMQTQDVSLETSEETTFLDYKMLSEYPEFYEFLENYNSNEVLTKLQELLGEKAGAEAFKTISNFFEKFSSKFQIQNDSDLTEALPKEILALLDLVKALDPDLTAEEPVEMQKANLEICIKEIKNILSKNNKEEEAEQDKESVENSEVIPVAELNLAYSNEDIAPYIEMLSSEMKIEPEDNVDFYLFINGLLENGVITKQDIKNAVRQDGETSDIIKALEKLYANIDKPGEKEEEIILAFKELVSESKKTNGNIENSENQTVNNKETKSKDVKPAETIDSFLKQTTADNKNVKAEAAQNSPVQGFEIRTTWEGSVLKIDIVDSRTGEKLQSTPAGSNMQERLHEFEVVKQVIAQAKFISTPTGEQRMTLQLRPEHLGQIDLKITLHNGEMQLYAKVESVTAQSALENHIGLLREGLEKQGITLDRLEVSVEQKENKDANALMQEHERQQRENRNKKRKNRQAMRLSVSVANNNEKSDTGRRLGYNTMEYLA